MAWTELYIDGAASSGGAGTIGDPWDWADMKTDLAANAGTGNRRYNVKGSFSHSSFQDFRGYDGTATNRLWFRGYTATSGDGGIFTITNSNTTLPAILWGDYTFIEGMDITQTVTREVLGGGVSYRRCLVTNLSTNAAAHCIISSEGAFGCDIVSAAGVALQNVQSVEHSRVTGAGVLIGFTDTFKGVVSRCSLRGTGTVGVGIQYASSHRGIVAIGNRIYNVTDGINIPSFGSPFSQIIADNIIYTCSGSGMDIGDTGTRMLIANNMIGNTTVAAYTGMGDAVIDPEISLTANPFTDAGNGDLSLNSTSGGGTLAKANGFAINEAYDWDNMTALATAEGGGGGGGGIGMIGPGGGMIGAAS